LPPQGVPHPPLIRNEGGDILSRQHTPIVEAEAAETLESTRSVSQSHPRVFHPPSGVRSRHSGKDRDLLVNNTQDAGDAPIFFTRRSRSVVVVFSFSIPVQIPPSCLPMISQSHPPSLPLLRKLPHASRDKGHHRRVGSHGSESLQHPPRPTCCRHMLHLHPSKARYPPIRLPFLLLSTRVTIQIKLLDYSIRGSLAPFISPGLYGWTGRGGAVLHGIRGEVLGSIPPSHAIFRCAYFTLTSVR
jgi:hypothetical protein